MKKIINALFVSALVFSFASCEKELANEDQISKKQPAIMQVHAGETLTKTAINEVDASNYTLTWKAGDQIAAYEVSTVTGTPTVQPKVASTALAADNASATFTMDFSGNAGDADFSYIFVYPAAKYNKVGGDYLAEIPASQTFTTTTFDPAADLLISETVSGQATRPTSVNVAFERIGATAKMNIKAPSTSEKIRAIYFSTTEGNIAGSVSVDPVAGTHATTISAGGKKEIELLAGADITYTGTIPVYFRLGAITLTNNFTVVVDTDAKTYTKTVNLASLSKTVEFKNSGLTKFNVDMSGVSGTANYISLTSSNITSMTGTTNGYGVEKTVTVSDNIWASTGWKEAAGSGFVQLKADTSPYLEIPPVPGIIRRVVLSVTSSSGASEGADKVNTTLSFKGDLTGDVLGSSSSASSSSKTINLSGTSYRSGYVINTAGNVARIWACTVYYTVDGATVSNLDIVTAPTKDTYTTDDDASDIDFKGGKAIATFTNGSVANVSRILSFSCDFSSTGAKTVTASYGGQSDTFDVTVEEAGDPQVYQLSAMTKTGTSTNDSAYAKAVDYEYTNNKKAITWNVTANSSTEPWRFGGKGSYTNTDRAVYSKTAIAENISKIEVISGNVSHTGFLNSVTISVHANSSDASTGSNAISTYTVSSGIDNSTVTFNRPDGKDWSGRYFRVAYNVTNTATSTAKYIQLNYINFYGK